ncbi:MAG: glycosyltransferase family 4 protein [Oscillatoria princeps RMCB-10]|jgi:glycosyltransferase involved in cell wall biosynthesis|nr:glycosyltransferase family 4 protein [Oscillatoria princeps RMCB-10]
MKILLVNDYGTPTGGAELMMLALREGLRQRGHDARLFASCAKGGAAESLADFECFGTTSSFRTLLQTANPPAAVKLRRVLAEFQPDIVHVKIFLTQLSPLILPLLKDIPSLYHVAWYRAICPLGTKMLPDGTSCIDRAGAVCYTKGCLPLRDWLPLMLQMKLWRQWRDAFNLIVANSEATKRRLVAEGIEPVEVVWYGIPIRPQRPPLSSPPTVAFAGRLVWEKGADILVRAFAKVAAEIPQARLLVAGDGPERDALASLISEHKLQQNVTFLGHLSREEMELHFASAWVQAVPSRWQEPFGIVAAEAMMRGTAAVASGSGGLTEIVRDGHTGFLIPPEDAGALTEALLRLLQNRDLAEQMGRSAREVALKDFSEATFVDRFIQLYKSLLENIG